MDSEFENINKKRGFSFGFGRDEVMGGPLEAARYTKLIPGPGQYPNPSTLALRSTTLKSRLADHSNKEALLVYNLIIM
jgi:hypothetical protein